MADDEFGMPASTQGVDWESEKGNLLAIKGIETKYAVPTEYGETDALVARVVVVDGPNAGTVYEETYVFPKVLQSSCRPLGRVTVGRLNQGIAKGKNNPPWILDDPSEKELDAAKRAWRNSLVSTPEFAKPGAGDSPY